MSLSQYPQFIFKKLGVSSDVEVYKGVCLHSMNLPTSKGDTLSPVPAALHPGLHIPPALLGAL